MDQSIPECMLCNLSATLALLDLTAPKILPGSQHLQSGRRVARTREQAGSSCGWQGLGVDQEGQQIARSTKILEQFTPGRFTQPQWLQLVDSCAVPSGAVSVPRSEAGRGTAPRGQPVLLGIRVTASALGMRVMALWII